MTKEEILDRLETLYQMLNSPMKKAQGPDPDFYPYMVGWITGELEYILRTEGRK